MKKNIVIAILVGLLVIETAFIIGAMTKLKKQPEIPVEEIPEEITEEIPEEITDENGEDVFVEPSEIDYSEEVVDEIAE